MKLKHIAQAAAQVATLRRTELLASERDAALLKLGFEVQRNGKPG